MTKKQKSKLDMNEDGKIDKEDFMMLRKSKKEMAKGGKVGMGCAEGGKVMKY